MKNGLLTSEAYLREFGARIKSYRIDSRMTQRQLAERSGVSLRCVQRVEQGEDVQASNLIKVMIALGLDERLMLLVPDVRERPVYHLESQRRPQRVRIRKDDLKGKQKGSNEVLGRGFKWGDEQ